MSSNDIDNERQVLLRDSFSTPILPLATPTIEKRNSYSYVSSVNYQMRNEQFVVIPTDNFKSTTTLSIDNPPAQAKSGVEKRKFIPYKNFFYGLLVALMLVLGLGALFWALTMKTNNLSDRAAPIESGSPITQTPAPPGMRPPESSNVPLFSTVLLKNVENPRALTPDFSSSSILVGQDQGVFSTPLDPVSFAGPVSIFTLPQNLKIHAIASTVLKEVFIAREFDANNIILTKIAADGNITDLTGPAGAVSSDPVITKISGLVADSNGDVYIADPVNNLIWKYSAKTQMLIKLAFAIKVYRLAVTSNFDLYFTANGSNSIRRVDEIGRTFAVDTTQLPGVGTANTFSNPQGIVATPNGNLIVADVGHSQLKLVNLATGQVVKVFDLPPSLGRDEVVDVALMDGNVIVSSLVDNSLIRIVPDTPNSL